MKTFKFLCHVVAFLWLVSCSEHVSDASKGITSSGCKSSRAAEELLEHLTYEVKDGYLEIVLHNYVVSCDVTQMGMEKVLDGNLLTLTPRVLDGGYVNCVCPMDFVFPVQGLVAEHTYQCTVKGKSISPYSFKFVFRKGEKGNVNLYINE